MDTSHGQVIKPEVEIQDNLLPETEYILEDTHQIQAALEDQLDENNDTNIHTEEDEMILGC